MQEKIDLGRSFLNAADRQANPYGLALSEEERGFIYGMLNTLDHRTSSILDGKTGWRPRLRACFGACSEVGGLLIGILALRYLDATIPVLPVFIVCFAFVAVYKLNLLLTQENLETEFARRERERNREKEERRRYFAAVRANDLSVDE